MGLPALLGIPRLKKSLFSIQKKLIKISTKGLAKGCSLLKLNFCKILAKTFLYCYPFGDMGYYKQFYPCQNSEYELYL